MPRPRPANPLDGRDPLAVIGKRLRAWRESRNMTQTELAQKAGMSQVSISLYERGRRTMIITAALRLARVLDLSVEALLTTDPQRKG